MRAALPFLLASALFAAPATLAAQAHGAQEAPAAKPSQGPAPEAASPSHGATPAHEAAPAAHGAEAPGHGTGGAHDGAAAHHGPEVKLPGMHRPLTPGEQYAIKLFNFLLFAGALVWALKGVLAAAFKARAQEIEERLDQAERDKAEGEAQVRELEARMAGLQGELAEILTRAEADAEAEKQRVLDAARAEAELILAQARAEIGFQQRQAEQDLRALVAELAVEGATERLKRRLEGTEAAPVLDRAIEQVGQRAEGVKG